MFLTNLGNGYIRISALGKSFVMALASGIVSVDNVRSFNEFGQLVADCTMSDGTNCIRYIGLSPIFNLLNVDKIAIQEVSII